MPKNAKTEGVVRQRRAALFGVLGLLFVSGFASLVYQVLWMRELALLFGSTSHATAATLAVFFGGLALGGAIWSRRAPRSQRPLIEYGVLEIGVGVLGGLYFALLSLYAVVYSPLHSALGETQVLLLLGKLVLAAGVLLPPAILMGGTLPLMSQHVIGPDATLGRVGTLLYAANTLGAASGALAAGFWLPAWLGFRLTYVVAIVASLVIGVIAVQWGRRLDPLEHRGREKGKRKRRKGLSEDESLGAPELVVAALGSGAFALALEVLWTRMFQQVLQNSVYTFSIILVVFLAALSAGAFAASRVARWRVDRWRALSNLIAAAGFGALATPFLFWNLTGGMRYLGAGEEWSIYVVSVFSGAVMVLFLPGLAVGAVFPYLLRVAERGGEAGAVVGRLSALNTIGALVGSLIAGFVLLGWLGLWSSIRLIAILYFLLAVSLVARRTRRVALVPLVGLLLAVTIADPSSLPALRIDPDTERVLASWEGPDGTVAVVERRGSRRIKVNNFYALGSSGAVDHERNQTLIPLMSHPSPERLFYLGMGTGITAGAALRLPSEHVTVTELVPEVVTAASGYFDEHAFGLFSDPRARVLSRDGRNELRGATDTYDAILADLFIPWRAGVGNLYSRDHYATARSRLRPGGVYVQWIPLYQVTNIEFWTIVRTFLDVFPQVRAWRGDFYVDKPILALVGSVDAEPLSPSAMVRNGRHLRGGADLDPGAFLAVTLPFYAGNLGASRDIVPEGPIHTDDRPIIEYQAPVSHRNARAGKANWFVGAEFIDFLNQLLIATPPDDDPYLSELDPVARGFVAAGLSYHSAAVARDQGRDADAQRHLRDFVALLPIEVGFETVGSGAAEVEEPGRPDP